MRLRVGCAVGMAWVVACAPVSNQAASAPTVPEASYGSELAQASLLEHVPADATFAAVVRRNALGWLSELLAGDKAAKADLSQHFLAELGVDFTEIRGLALVGFAQGDAYDGALYVDVPASGKLRGPARGVHRAVALVGVDLRGEYVGASVGKGVWVGHERAVRRALDHMLDGGPALALSEDSEDADLIGYLAMQGLEAQALNTLSREYGLHHAVLTIDSERRARLRIQGADQRVDQARVALALGLRAALLEAHKLTKLDQAETPWGSALALVGYHQMRRFVEAIEPRVEGKVIVSEYHFEPLLSSTVFAFVATMIATPIVLDAMQDQRKSQAIRELERIADALIAYHGATRPALLDRSTPPKVALLRLARTPATVPCGTRVAWNEEDMALWQDAGYAPLEPMHYALSVGHPSAYDRIASEDHVLLIRAEADLDCDGVLSRFDLMLRLDAQGNLVKAGKVEAQNTAK
jgi:hypothetical protein